MDILLDKYTVILVPSGSATAAINQYNKYVDTDANPFMIKLWPSITTDFTTPPSHYLMAKRVTLLQRMRIEGLLARINNANIQVRDIDVKRDSARFFSLLDAANLVRQKAPLPGQ